MCLRQPADGKFKVELTLLMIFPELLIMVMVSIAIMTQSVCADRRE